MSQIVGCKHVILQIKNILRYLDFYNSLILYLKFVNGRSGKDLQIFLQMKFIV